MDNFKSTVEKHAEALSEQYQPLLDMLAPREPLRDKISEFLTEHKETMPDAAYKELMEAAALLKPVRLFKVTFVHHTVVPRACTDGDSQVIVRQHAEMRTEILELKMCGRDYGHLDDDDKVVDWVMKHPLFHCIDDGKLLVDRWNWQFTPEQVCVHSEDFLVSVEEPRDVIIRITPFPCRSSSRSD